MPTHSESTPHRPILGVFDSGFGGLTVLRALLPLIPNAHYIYVGDTARLPYGAKSHATVARYAVESARFLAAQGAHALVIACNTATALALDDIRAAVPIPVIGVIEPGAQAAASALRPATKPAASKPAIPNQRASAPAAPVSAPGAPLIPRSRRSGDAHSLTPEVLVLATAATVQSHAYRAACAALGLRATEKACPLLVPLVEEGWIDHPITRQVLQIYLQEATASGAPSAVLLGCTHYPLLKEQIRSTLRTLGHSIDVIDSAETTARHTAHSLGFTAPQPHALPATFHCYATDSVEKFARLGSAFLGQPIPEAHLLDLGG